MNINEKIKEMSSISELKEIAKYISKEEFLKKVINYNNACPKIINLEDCGDHGICSTTPCYSCWENAIKDIKFKGENDMEFDWEGFRRNKFIVWCNTEEKAKDFLQECYKRKMHWNGEELEETVWNEYKDETCYSNDFNYDNKLGYGRKSFYLDKGYEVIEWEIENPKKDKEYSIQDILTMKEELEFIGSNGLPYKIKNGYLYVYFIEEDKWEESGNSIQEILNMTFTLRYKDKKVSFEEAIQAYGKEVYCIWIDTADMKHKSEYKIYSNESILKDQNEDPISPVEIFEGEWYIKED